MRKPAPNASQISCIARAWAFQLIEDFLWQRADQRLAELEQAGEDGLLLWDESVIEKPESIA